MINKNKKAFSLVIAMFLMIVTSLLSMYLLEYIIPFSRNTKWMENWTKAYYEANKWIEDVLFAMKWEDAYYETGTTSTSDRLWYYYTLTSTWTKIPIAWDWTSEFDNNYNKISISNPVQLMLKWDIKWDEVKFYFKVPHFDDTSSTAITFTWITDPIINWQLSSEIETLNSSWSHIYHGDISESTWALINIPFDSKPGYTLSWATQTFSAFYNDWTNLCSTSWCILKLSVVNELLTDWWKKIPYLEYKIEFPSGGTNPNVANYYSIIRTSWKSTWYRRDLKLYIPQQTTIEAFDFTVFQ